MITGFSYLLSEPAPVGRVIHPRVHTDRTTVQTTADRRTNCNLQSNTAVTGSSALWEQKPSSGRQKLNLTMQSVRDMKHCGLVCGTTELFQLFLFFTEKYPNHRTYEEDHEGSIKAQLALTKWNVIFLSHLSFFRKPSPTHSCTKLNITAALWCCSSSVCCLMTGSSVSYSAIMWRVVSSPCDSFTGTLPVCEVLHWVQLSEGLIGHSWHLRLGPISRKGSCHRVRSLKCHNPPVKAKHTVSTHTNISSTPFIS